MKGLAKSLVGGLVPSIEIGQKVPNIKLESTQGSPFELNHLKGQWVILFFYPKDATPGCTIEGHDFSALKLKFEKLNAVVFGISRDTIKSHLRFKEKQNYKIELLSDFEESACQIFDVVKDKNMYGKKVRGIERSTFVIDPEQNLVKEWRKVKVEGHAEEVLQWLLSLKS